MLHSQQFPLDINCRLVHPQYPNAASGRCGPGPSSPWFADLRVPRLFWGTCWELRAKHRNLSAKNGAAGQIRIQPPNMVISYDFIMKQGEFSGVYTKIQN